MRAAPPASSSSSGITGNPTWAPPWRLAVSAGSIWIGALGQQRVDHCGPVLVGGDDQGGVAVVVATIGIGSGFEQGDGDSRLRARESKMQWIEMDRAVFRLDSVSGTPRAVGIGAGLD